jgi:uncharacterized membrane protein YgaE (UPF0421/DUF939 family)
MDIDPNVIYSVLGLVIVILGIISAWWKKINVDLGKFIDAMAGLGSAVMMALQDLQAAYADKNVSDEEYAKMLGDYRTIQQKYNEMVEAGKATKADFEGLYNDILNAINEWRARRNVEKLSLPAIMKVAKGSVPG